MVGRGVNLLDKRKEKNENPKMEPGNSLIPAFAFSGAVAGAALDIVTGIIGVALTTSYAFRGGSAGAGVGMLATFAFKAGKKHATDQEKEHFSNNGINKKY